MSGSHVSPERWADLAAGRVSTDEAARLLAHAASCASCTGERARVDAARSALSAIAEAEPPPLPWERIGAHVHWTISRQMRETRASRSTSPPRARAWRWLAVTAAAAALGVTGWVVLGPPGGEPAPPVARPSVPAPAPRPVPPTPPAIPTPATPLGGVVTLLAGKVTLDGAPLTAERLIAPGQRLTTGEGRVHVQFGQGSAFVLEPRSVLELARFDSREVELRVEGAVGVTLAHRAPEQRFQVVAGGRRVEVRGTIFRVASGPEGLGVAVTRGRVAVLEGADSVEVPAGSWLSAPLGAGLVGLTARPLDDEEARAAAAQLAVHAMAVWPGDGAEAAHSTSALLRLNAPAGALVRVDGVGIGQGTLVARVTAGRHQVAIGTHEEWIDARPGATESIIAPSKHVSERAGQVEEELGRHRSRLEGCAENARRVTPDFGGELVVEIEIGADGALRSVGALRGLPDRDAEECVLKVVREQFTFPSGSRDVVRKSIRF